MLAAHPHPTDEYAHRFVVPTAEQLDVVVMHHVDGTAT
jgi:hypothetical protein